MLPEFLGEQQQYENFNGGVPQGQTLTEFYQL